MSNAPYTNPFEIVRELLLWVEAIRDFFPDFETRMINRERRFKLRYAEGKITAERLEIEQEAITEKRKAHAEK